MRQVVLGQGRKHRQLGRELQVKIARRMIHGQGDTSRSVCRNISMKLTYECCVGNGVRKPIAEHFMIEKKRRQEEMV